MATLQEIQDQIAQLQKQAETLAKAERKPIIEKIKGEIKTYGITAKELGFTVSKPVTEKPKTDNPPLPPKYEKGELTWSGRGRQPSWVKEFLSAGGDLKSLLIK